MKAIVPCPDCQGQWMYINRIANPARTCDGGPQEDGIDHEGATVIELTEETKIVKRRIGTGTSFWNIRIMAVRLRRWVQAEWEQKAPHE